MAHKRKELIQKQFKDELTSDKWKLIADALFEKQSLERERLRDVNASEAEWRNVDETYTLYLEISTFMLS